MAEIRLGLDPSGVRTGIEEIARSFRTLIDASRQAQQAISQISAPVIKLRVDPDLAGIARVESALAAVKAPSLKLAVDTTQAVAAIERVDAQIAASKAPTLKLNVDATQAVAQIAKVSAATTELQSPKVIPLVVDSTQIVPQLEAIRGQIAALRAPPPIPLAVDASSIVSELSRVQSTLAALKPPPLELLLDTTQVLAQIDRLQTSLAALKTPTIQILVDTQGIIPQIERLQALLAEIHAPSLRLAVDTTQILPQLESVRELLVGLRAPPIKLVLDSSSIAAEVESALASVKAAQLKLHVEPDLSGIAILEKSLESLRSQTIALKLDATQALAEIEKVRGAIQSLSAIPPATVAAPTNATEQIVRVTEATEKQTQAVNGLAQAQGNQAGQTDLLKQADAALAQTTLQAAAASDRHLQAGTQEAAMVEKIARGLTSLDAATRKSAQAQATLLSTFGGSERALSQFAVALSRVQKGLEGGTISIQQAAKQIATARERFTTANINAKDLRLNMQALNQSFASLAGALAFINPQLAIGAVALQQVSHAAAGFTTLGLQFGIVAGAISLGIAAFTTLAIVGTKAADTLRLVDAALQSSGQASGLTTRQIDEFATKLSQSTTVSNDRVLELSRSLIQFRGITVDTFQQVITSAQDAAARGFGSFEENARTIARALTSTNELGRGFRQLGIVLSASEEEQIKNLAAVGDQAQRSQAILTALADRLAGGGAAEAGTVSGAFHILKNSISNMLEEMDRGGGVSEAFRQGFFALADSATAAANAIRELSGETKPETSLAAAQEARQRAEANLAKPGLSNEGRVAQERALTKAIQEENEAFQRMQETQRQALEDADIAVRARHLQAIEGAQDDEASFQKFITQNDAKTKAAKEFAEQSIILNNLAQAFIDTQGQVGISEQEHIKRMVLLRKVTLDVAEAEERRAEKAAAKKAATEAAAATKAYADAIAGLRAEEEKRAIDAIHGSEERLDDLKFEIDLAEKRAVAITQGTQAVRDLAAAEASLREQRKGDKELRDTFFASDEELERARELIRLRVEAAGKLEQQNQAIKKTQEQIDAQNKIWENAIENIQEQWSQLWANLLSDGSATFKDLTSNIKGLFTSLLGNLISGEFAIFFKSLKDGVSGASSAGGTPGVPGANQGDFSGFFADMKQAVSEGVESGLTALGDLFNTSGTSGFGAIKTTGDAIGAIASSVGGVLAGIQINNQLMAHYMFKLEKTLGKVGELVGGLAGSILGSIYGGPAGGAIGGALGSVVGGIIGTGAGGLISAGIHGRKLNETNTFGQDYLRNFVLSGDPIGALVTTMILRNKTDLGLLLQTAKTPTGFSGPLQGGSSPVQSAFGFLGALGSGTGGDLKRGQVSGVLRAVAGLDLQIRAYLTSAETALVAAALQVDPKKFSNIRSTTKIFVTRAQTALQAVGVPEQTTKDLLEGVKPEDIAKTVGEFLQQRRAIQDLIDQLRGVGQEANGARDALAEIEKKMEEIRLAAPDLGIVIDDFDALQAAAIAKAKEAFATGISDSILAITDPFALAFQQLAEAEAQRLREATTFGADLVEVERLTGLERQKLLEQFNAPIQDTINAIQISPSGSSPLTALGTSESRFFSLANTPGASRSDIAAAAQSFLGLGEQFLGGPTFSAKRDLVLSTLESLLLTLPGVSADTGEQLDGLNLETARGNAANEQLLANLITETSAMRNEIVLLNTKLERALAK